MKTNAMPKPNEITEDDFYEKFKPQKNHLDDNASFGGCMFETYGKELDYIHKLAQISKRVWTIIEAEDKIFYSAGFHIVNRMGFLVTEKEWVTGLEEVETD